VLEKDVILGLDKWMWKYLIKERLSCPRSCRTFTSGEVVNTVMPKTKSKARKPSKCWKCEGRHFPPTGAKSNRPKATEADQMLDDNTEQQLDDMDNSLNASSSEPGITSFSNLPQPGPSSNDLSLQHEMRNMTAILSQLITRIDNQDIKFNQMQANYNAKF
jgi:hypothetical protein